ncbi:hypothetical protein EUX98_g416 [Antrodiella citrinella]|uniref:DUF6593 domain-containing protein n=1 Tax=Antrodiella citrinella TaxID=2447956 RepID=A0A4V3XJN5_9APHY|nr:hypothetical protein EUX98_g416 [Antrodiella citrinella]
MSASSSNEILSWTSQDPRQSALFSSYGVFYRFQTDVNAHGQSVTTLWRAIRANKEDRVAKLEWAPNGGFGRAVIGKCILVLIYVLVQSTLPMADLVRTVPEQPDCRVFNGPDGYQYRWRPSGNSYNDVVLEDHNDAVIAFYRPVRPVRYNLGDVYGELHFCRSAALIVERQMHPPLMDTVTVTAMLYRFATAYNL